MSRGDRIVLTHILTVLMEKAGHALSLTTDCADDACPWSTCSIEDWSRGGSGRSRNSRSTIEEGRDDVAMLPCLEDGDEC